MSSTAVIATDGVVIKKDFSLSRFYFNFFIPNNYVLYKYKIEIISPVENECDDENETRLRMCEWISGVFETRSTIMGRTKSKIMEDHQTRMDKSYLARGL